VQIREISVLFFFNAFSLFKRYAFSNYGK